MWTTNRDFALAAGLLAAMAVASVAQEAQPIGVLKSGALPQQSEARLIGLLKSSASPEAKSAACRQLARVAGKDSVPALAALLGDEKLSHMARYALETIPAASVDDALRDALGKVKGRPLLGVIGSLGVRRDARAVDALAKLLACPDGEVAQAAARALGNIGNAEATQAWTRRCPPRRPPTGSPFAKASSAAPSRCRPRGLRHNRRPSTRLSQPAASTAASWCGGPAGRNRAPWQGRRGVDARCACGARIPC